VVEVSRRQVLQSGAAAGLLMLPGGVARAASTYKIQRLGNEAGLPTTADIEAVKKEYGISA